MFSQSQKYLTLVRTDSQVVAGHNLSLSAVTASPWSSLCQLGWLLKVMFHTAVNSEGR